MKIQSSLSPNLNLSINPITRSNIGTSKLLGFSPVNASYKNSNNIDTYTKSISFGQNQEKYGYEAFEKWSGSTGFLSKASQIIASQENIIGFGTEGKTYKIPNNENWVIKVLNNPYSINSEDSGNKIIRIKDKSPSINVGQAIAQIKLPDNTDKHKIIYILKKQKGKPYGIPFEERNRINQINIKRHINCLKMLADFPPASYEKLVRTISQANFDGYKIDYYNPNNFMIDEENKEINIVDVKDSKDIHSNLSGEILYALLDGDFAVNFNRSNCSVADKITASRLSNEIIYKYEQAAKKCGMRIEKTIGYMLMLKKLA